MSTTTILYIVLATIVACLMAFFQYFYKTSQRGVTDIGLAILRFLAIFSILLLLINPKFKSRQFINIPPTLNVIVDNSSSIAYAKQEDKVNTFLAKLKDNLAVNKNFNVNYYALADDLYQQDSFSFDRPETNISRTLKTLASFNKGNVAPIILLTDGNQTYGSSYEFYKSEQQLYPVVLGDTLKYDDIKINQVNVNSYTNLNNKFPVEVFLQYQGDKTVKKVFTVSQNNSIVFKQQVEFSNKKNSQKIVFYLKGRSVGMQNYKCMITTLENEKNTLNNRKNFSVEVIDEQAIILIISAINHPDIGMIKRSVESNKQRKVVVKNDLNESFKLKDYQLVILYQPTQRFEKVFAELEKQKSNFFIYTGLQTDWDFLNTAQSLFTKGNINATETFAAEFNSSYDEFIIEDIGYANFPPLSDFFGEISFSVPYNTILYQNIAEYTTKNPLLATFTNQNRRGAVLFGENSWKWRMLSNIEQNSFEKFDTFFNKIIQYLSSNKRSSQLDIKYKPLVYNNSDAIISAQFFDATYTFDNTANLLLQLINKTSNATSSLPFTLQNNKFEVVLKNLKPGDYSFKVTVDGHSIYKGGNFTVSEYDIEQQFITANTDHLKKVANASNGGLFHIEQSDQLFTGLLSDKRYTAIQKSTEKTMSLIDWKWLLSLVILFFSIEWFIRKYKGLV